MNSESLNNTTSVGSSAGLDLRRLLAGFLAGVSGVVAIMAVIALIMVSGGLWELLRDVASGLRGELPFWPTLAQAVGSNLASLPIYFWSGRWGVLAFAVLGVVLAVVDGLAARTSLAWRAALPLVTTLGLVGAIVFGMQYANRENLLVWMAEQPELFSQRSTVLVSNAGSLVLGLLITLPVAYLCWLLWHWWYERWCRRVGVQPVAAPARPHGTPARAEVETGDWRAYQERLHRLRSGADMPSQQPAAAQAAPPERSLLGPLAIGLAVATLAVFGALHLYQVSGSQVVGGDLWVSPEEPAGAVQVHFTRSPVRLVVSNIFGQGSVELTVRQNMAEVSRQELQLLERMDRYQVVAVDLTGRPEGTYQLEAQLHDGAGGRLTYVALQGGGEQARLAGWLIGVAAGAWLIVAAAVALEARAR